MAKTYEQIKAQARLRNWVRRHKGRPSTCSMCGQVNNEKGVSHIQWVSISRNRLKDVTDYIALCYTCQTEHSGRTKRVATNYSETEWIKMSAEAHGLSTS